MKRITIILSVSILFLIYFLEIAYAQSNQNQDLSIVENNSSQALPWIGASYVTITEEIANVLGLKESKEPIGVVVTEITTGGAAEEAGLLAGNTSGFIGGEEIRLGGDLILRADNTTIKNATALNEIIRKKEVGDNLTLTIFRGDHIKDIPVNVSSRPGIYFENSSIYSEPENITFVSYESLDLELGIKHPSNWDIDDYSRPDSVYFRSLPEYSSDSARDYLRIDVEEGYGDSSDTFACCFWFFIAQN